MAQLGHLLRVPFISSGLVLAPDASFPLILVTYLLSLTAAPTMSSPDQTTCLNYE